MSEQMNQGQAKADPSVVAKRPAHELNDARVVVRAGAKAKSRFAMGATLNGGGGHVGIVHGVVNGTAMVDFGRTMAGTQLGPMLVAAGDLEVAS